MRKFLTGLTVLAPSAFVLLSAGAATRALDLADASVRARQPKFEQVSHACGAEASLGPSGPGFYRYKVTKSWSGELPQWPSVNLKPTVTNWTGYGSLVLDVYNDAIGGDALDCFIAGPDGRIQNGLGVRALPLGDYAYVRWEIPLDAWPEKTDPANIGRVHFFMTTPSAANVMIGGFYLLKKGEKPPPVDARFASETIRAGEEKRLAALRERRRASVERFVARCRAAGQTGDPCWFGKATGMENVRPRDSFDAQAADAFSLRLARGERESLQVLVMPNGRDLAGVSVQVSDLADGQGHALRSDAFKVAPVGYVQTTSPAPYRSGFNVATNLPGGYFRETRPNTLGWWADPILGHLDRADVKGDDLQSFWVRLTCPPNQPAGVYRGSVRVKGTGWERTFPLSVRVYGFSVPKASPLPLAITFSPGPSTQFADAAQLALADKLRKDPLAPVNLWRNHASEWADFLADYYITIDSLYHPGDRVRWDALLKLKDEGRLGRFNLGYWGYPKELTDAAKDAWLKHIRAKIGPTYAKAKELGLLDHAYLYGCDEVHAEFFPNIKWALSMLKREFPGVPLSTTAYDRNFGVGSELADMDWFTPTTDRYEEDLAKVPGSRAAGHQVWWYIACGQRAPRANLFVEGQAIEARQLMGAQTVKYRPDGFLYYQLSIWNSLRCIEGKSTFTDWNPRSWTSYHGDGSWFCCGPDGTPCATIRMENFRDGLEDYAYAREYERLTGEACDVPPEVCRSVWQFTDDPSAYYAWRDALAERIEKLTPKGTEEEIADWTRLADAASVARHVRAHEGTAPARFVKAGTIELPANLSTVPGERVSWDFDLDCDLKRADGIAFDFCCSDVRPISGFSIYFKSGAGWYTGSYAPVTTGRYHRIFVDKSMLTRTEGAPAGWGKVSAIRFGFWRSRRADTLIGIANLRKVVSDHDVVIVRGDSSTARNPKEDYAGRAAAMTGLVRKIGLSATQISDCDLDEEALRGVKLLALPYCSCLPEGVLERIRSFVARGGKLLCCYSLPQGLAPILGLKSHGFCNAKRRPVFARVVGFRKVGEGLPGQPAFVPQASPHMIDVEPAGEGRVLAAWVDGEGNEAGSALVETPAGFYLSHVWMAHDVEARQLMRAIAASVDPSVKARLEAAEEALRKQEAEDAAWVARQPSKPGEWRAFWCHSELGLGGSRTWDDSIRILKENGFNAILPNLAWATKIYETKDCLEACRKYGVECHIWKVCWRGNSRMKDMRLPGACQKSFDGVEKTSWMCPSDPANLAAEIEAFVTLAKLGPTGVHFDYIRYPDDKHCSCDGCRRRFERQLGHPVANWPADVRKDEELKARWDAFRRANITALVRAVSERVRRECPGVQLSAAVFHNVAGCPRHVGQDWPAWCREGLVDFVCPMDYYMGSSAAFRSLVTSQIEACAGAPVKIRPGLGLSCWKQEDRDAFNMTEQIGIVRELGLDGFTVFNYDARAERVLPALHTGPTK